MIWEFKSICKFHHSSVVSQHEIFIHTTEITKLSVKTTKY